MSIESSCTRPLGLAIVGCGQIVIHHASGMLQDQWQVRALVDPNPERRSVIETLANDKQLILSSTSDSPKQFKSLDDLIADTETMSQIDVIFIAVPHDLHEALATQALQSTTADKYIVLEKPLAITSESLDRLVQASRESQGRLIVAEQSPYWQEVVLAKQLIEQSVIGKIVSAAAYYYESMRDNVTSGSVDGDGGLGWRGEYARAGGGIAMDGGLHWIRPLREMCGRINRVVGVIRHGLAPELKMELACESVGHAIFEMEALQPQPEAAGPLMATYSCNMLATAPMAHDTCPYFRITGNQGELVIHGDGLLRQPGAGGLRLYNEANPQGREQFAETREGGFFLGFAGLWKEISRIVQSKDVAAAHATVERAADDVRVVLALYRSSKSKQWEECK